jgi:hypothetical protein
VIDRIRQDKWLKNFEMAAVAVFMLAAVIILATNGFGSTPALLPASPDVSISVYAYAMPNNGWAPLTVYFSNLNGYTSRGKVRVRWYHELFREVPDAILEFKIKEGEVGRKEQFPFPAFTMAAGLTEADFRAIARDSDLPEFIRWKLRDLEFTLMNRYKRWYFATPGQRYRLTVDAELSFCRLSKFGNNFNHFWQERGKHILELKYQSKDDPDVHRITSGLPFRVTRSSKYIAGVDQVYL